MRVSSACCTTGKFNSPPRISASRIMWSSRIGFPSSVTAIAPAVWSAPKSVSTIPLLARVAAAIGNTFTTAPRSAAADPLHPIRRIHDGRGVRHSANRSEPSRGRGCCSSSYRLFVRLPRLAQMHVQIDESGRNHQTASIEPAICTFNFPRRRDLSHPPILQQNIHGRIDARRRINKVSARNQQTRFVVSLQSLFLQNFIRVNPPGKEAEILTAFSRQPAPVSPYA